MSVEHSLELDKLAGALVQAQSEIKGAIRGSVNPHFGSAYADLASVWDACRGPLTGHGLAVIQAPTSEGVQIAVTTMLLHTSGQWMRSTVATTPRDLSPQSVGSATTYLRRYGLAAMVGVTPEDDDGNAAQGDKGEKPVRKRGPRQAGESPAEYTERKPTEAPDPTSVRFPPKFGNAGGLTVRETPSKDLQVYVSA